MSKKIKWGVAVIALLIISLLLYAVYSATSINMDTPSYHVIAVAGSSSNSSEFLKSLHTGFNAAASEFEMTHEICMTENESASEQITLLERAVNKKPDAIILSAIDSDRLKESAQKVVDSGIPLITVNSDVAGNYATALVSTDNIALGVKLGTKMQSLISTQGSFFVVGYTETNSTTTDRVNGINQAMENAEDRCSGILYCRNSIDRAKDLALQQLKQYPQTEGIIAVNEISSTGIIMALKEADMLGKIHVVTTDSASDIVDALEKGYIDASVVQMPYNMGYMAMKTAYNAILGNTSSSFFDTGSVLIDKSNMYTPENQGLLVPPYF